VAVTIHVMAFHFNLNLAGYLLYQQSNFEFENLLTSNRLFLFILAIDIDAQA
jgi:hypothetical protein